MFTKTCQIASNKCNKNKRNMEWEDKYCINLDLGAWAKNKTSQPTVFGLSAEVVTILSITGAISNALKLILAWES